MVDSRFDTSNSCFYLWLKRKLEMKCGMHHSWALMHKVWYPLPQSVTWLWSQSPEREQTSSTESVTPWLQRSVSVDAPCPRSVGPAAVMDCSPDNWSNGRNLLGLGEVEKRIPRVCLSELKWLRSLRWAKRYSMNSFLGEGMCFLTSPRMLLGKQTASVQARCGTTEHPILFFRLALLAFEAVICVTMSNLHFFLGRILG